MQRTKIEWTDYTWNPIKGLCPVGCWYCYGRAIYKRFKMNPEVRFALDDAWHLDKLHRLNPKPGAKIFICSTFELFHPAVNKEWRDIIFEIIEMNPHLTFQILTKMPENIDRPMPDNVWLGVSVTGKGDQERMVYLQGIKAKVKFISFEPLLGNPFPQGWCIPKCVNWAIVGRLTGHGKKHDPKREWIERIIQDCRQDHRRFSSRRNEIPIFLKNNLKEIWGEKLIQEFPL